jgi:intein/homing endonuclease
MANHPELEMAIDEIVNEAITRDEFGNIIDINLDKLKQPDSIKKKISDEFKNVQKMLNFKNLADDLFKRWYIDGRLFYQVVVDEATPKEGIKELRYIDPRKIRKVREVNRDKDPRTGAMVIKSIAEYYVYSERGTTTQTYTTSVNQGVRVSPDSIINVNSGLMDAKNTFVISYLHKAIKPLNQLRMIEDAVVIYRLCLTGDTRVKTNTGWKYIKDIQENDVVYSYYGPNKGLIETNVKKQWQTGIKKTYKVSSKHFSVTGSDNHPILVYDRQKNAVEYVDIKDIRPKDHFFVYEKPIETFNNIKFPDIRNTSLKLLNPKIWINYNVDIGKEKFITKISSELNIKRSSVRNFLYGAQYLNENDVYKIIDYIGLDDTPIFDSKYEFLNKSADVNLPDYIDEDFARLYGFLLGDGSVHKNGITFAEGVDLDQNLFYASLLSKYFGNCRRYNSKRKYTNYTTSNTLAAELFKKLGWKTGSKNKRFPDFIWKCSDHIKKQFILGFCDADGCNKDSVYTGSWSSEIELSNKQLVEDIKELWTSIGLTSGKIRYRVRKEETRVFGSEDSERTIPQTESWCVRISDYDLPNFDKILSIDEDDIQPVYELEVESEKHNFVANGVVVHNSRAPERRIFYIDVGNLPKGKAEQYLRDVMIKYRNKMVYDASTGELRDDRKHLCLSMDTKVPLLDGRTLTLSEIADEYKEKQLWAYSCDPITGKFSPGLITWAGVSIKDAKVMKITLDNGESITCTPDHKFPVWNKNLVCAKDLVIGDSMIPFYKRELAVSNGSNKNYEQIFENETKQWKFTHRLISSWKDSVNMNNLFVFNEQYKDGLGANIVHHKNFNRFDNTPENLVKMHNKDHWNFHRSSGSNSGKIGGKRAYELGVGFHNKNHPEYKEWHIKAGKIGGKTSAITGKSQKNRDKGRKILSLLLKDQEFNSSFREKQKEGWTQDKRDVASDNAKKNNLSSKGNKAKQELFKNEHHRKIHEKKYKTEYTDEIISFVKNIDNNNLSILKCLEKINSNVNFNDWKKLNSNKVGTQKNWNKLVKEDLIRIANILGFESWSKFKESKLYRNHKVVSIEYLNDPIDVGCLTIDGNEIYHNNHTFALSAGIYTQNSMLEDFWLPRREGGKGTEITTLPAGQNLGELEDVKYFRNKLLNALNVPISRLEPQDGGMIGIGRTTEVTRDEVKFSKFIQRLRIKFSRIFDEALRIQLSLKGICTTEEWEEFKEDIFYDYKKDNNFTELRDAELLRERLTTLGMVEPYIGKYYSMQWVKKYILQLTEEEIDEMDKEIENEAEMGITSVTQDQLAAQSQQDIDPNQYPPEDNVAESDTHESKTPMLDNEVQKYQTNN